MTIYICIYIYIYIYIHYTLPESDTAPENGRLVSFWDGLFSGAMLALGGVLS